MVSPAPPPALPFDTDFDPRTGEAVALADGVVRVTAPNRGPFTFTGTNSFILGHAQVLVVDPGPDDERHLAALIAAIGARRVEAILLTHTHVDHSALAGRLRKATGAPLWFGQPMGRAAAARGRGPALTPDRTLRDRERFAAAGMTIDVHATPGHCADHLCFGLHGTPFLLSGDHVMGWSTTMVPVPDGSMTDYLDSLEKIIAAPYRRFLPGHGGPIADGPAYARALREHRQFRNAQILDAVSAGARTFPGLLRRIYPDLTPALMPAALMTLRAHVEHLAERGEVRVRRTLLRSRITSPRR